MQTTTEDLGLQHSRQGCGPYYHRTYRIGFSSERSAEELMNHLKVNINEFTPQMLARFEKTEGATDRLSKGDRFMIYITGPWNGPVEVLDVGSTWFTLGTLEGHLEAGRITFRLEERSGKFTFTIESLARSHTTWIDLLYDKIPVARLAQTEMWQKFCRLFAAYADSTEKTFEVDIQTERWSDEMEMWEVL